MRKIEIIDDVRLRFPGRDAEFDVGIEVGSVCVLLAQGHPCFQRQLSGAAVEQLRPIADHFRYALIATEGEAGAVDVTFSPRTTRPALRLVR